MRGLIKRLRRRPYRLGLGVSLTRRGGAIPEEPYYEMVYISSWMNSASVGTWQITMNVQVMRNAHIYNTSDASGDSLTYRAFILAGTYTWEILYHGSTDRGIVELSIDDVVAGSVDMYESAFSPNLIATVSGITVVESGMKNITIRVADQNPSSTSYIASHGEMVLYRTA